MKSLREVVDFCRTYSKAWGNHVPWLVYRNRGGTYSWTRHVELLPVGSTIVAIITNGKITSIDKEAAEELGHSPREE